jgi:integrase
MADRLEVLLAGVSAALVFTMPDGAPWTMGRLRRRFMASLDLAGLVGDWSPHSIRHTAATWARRKGVPLDKIAELLGHSGLGQVLRYAHFVVDDLNPALDAVSAIEAQIGERTVNEKQRIVRAGF